MKVHMVEMNFCLHFEIRSGDKGSSEENNKEEKEQIEIEFTKKTDPEMQKMLLTLDDRVYMKKTRKILFWLT